MENTDRVGVRGTPQTASREPPPPARPRTTALGGAARAVPNLLVLFALGGLGYWGCQTGWKVPKFSEATGAAEAKDDWCEEHGVPESVCVECNPDLLPRPKAPGWCKVHGVHECLWEHPELAQTRATPKVTEAAVERANRALLFAARPENNPKCKLGVRRIQFQSEDDPAKVGIDVDLVREGPVVEAVAANGEITYDPTRVAALAAPAAGRVWRVYRELGQSVKKDDVLALVDAADVGKAKSEFLQALAQIDVRARTVERLKPLSGAAVAGAQLQEAEAALREAQIRLVAAQQALANLGLPVQADDLKKLPPEEVGRRVQFLGIPDEAVKTLDAGTTTANLLPIRSPLDGVVVARKAVVGEQADASKTLFEVADTRQMWLTLGVRQEDAGLIRARDEAKGAAGHAVRFRPEGAAQEVAGEAAWVSTAVDERTRTVQVRAVLANPDGRLRDHAFGAGRVILREEKQAVVVPSESVQWDGNCTVVFVRDKNFFTEGAPKVFHTRTVRVGAKDGPVTEVIAGVLPGEVVASKGSGVLRAELLKNNLGEG
jgi:cobalt-zinc-cadmium efflux system membrane fusion protein